MCSIVSSAGWLTLQTCPHNMKRISEAEVTNFQEGTWWTGDGVQSTYADDNDSKYAYEFHTGEDGIVNVVRFDSDDEVQKAQRPMTATASMLIFWWAIYRKVEQRWYCFDMVRW